MEEDGRGEEGGREAMGEVEPPAFISPLYSVYPEELWENRCLEAEYNKSGGIQWKEDAILYYRDDLDDTEKDEFLKVPASDLDYLCSDRDPSWLRNMLTDAVVFFKLHNTWQVYICPSSNCLRWFSEGDSLVLHLMNEHCNAWPFLRQNLTEEQWCAKALCSTVWKPIDVKVALNTLSTISRDGNSADSPLDVDHLASLEWPLSEDLGRNELLEKLQSRFRALLNSRERDSFSLCSNGCLRALIAVASEEILRHLDPTNVLPPPFRALMYSSPLSFRFMEAKPLGSFLRTVERMCDLVEDQASQNRELEAEVRQDQAGDVNWRQYEFFEAVSFPSGCDDFVLDVEKLKLCGIDEQSMGSWLFEAPMFPMIRKLPAKASAIFGQVEGMAASFSKCLTQSDLKLASLTSCLKMWITGHWPTSLLGKLSPEMASNSESNAANANGMPSAERQRIDFCYQHYLKLIELTCEVQCLELQLCRLCAVDLRAYIVPLLRSYLRMKLYVFIRIGSWTGDVKEEDADEGYIMGGSREEHPEEHVHSKVKGEPAAEDGSDVMMPDLSSYKRSEELSSAPLELGSSGSSAIGISDLDPMMIDEGEALGGEAPGAGVGSTDSRASQVGSAAAAPSRSRAGILAAITESKAKPEALPKSDAETELKAEPEFQWSRGPLWWEFDMYSDSDLSESKGESENGGQEMEEFSNAVWFMREKSAWETKDNGLFICMTINDVVKHCLENISSRSAALNIWGLKTNRTLKYWRCCICDCDKRFPDQKSHMLHMESEHGLGLSWDHGWLVPSQVWQEGQSGVNEGVKERTHSPDDSITIDCAYRTFLVEIEKLGSSLQNEKEGEVPNSNLCENIARFIRQELPHLENMLDLKCKLCGASEMIGALDAEIIQNFIRLKELKQNLSDLCVFDYKNEILHSVSSFLKKQKLMDCGLRSWTLRRLNDLLLSVRCPWRPDSFSIKLTSPGKVVINIEEHDAVIGFAYIGICWDFTGDLSFEGSRNIKGTFMFSGASTPGGIQFDRKVILDKGCKMTTRAFHFRNRVGMNLTLDLLDKLYQFQAEFRWMLQRLIERKVCVSV